MSIGDFPEMLSQQILVGINLGSEIGVQSDARPTCFRCQDVYCPYDKYASKQLIIIILIITIIIIVIIINLIKQ